MDTPKEVVMTPDEVQGLINDTTTKAVADVNSVIETKAAEIAEKKFEDLLKAKGNPFNFSFKPTQPEVEPKPTEVFGRMLQLTNQAKSNKVRSSEILNFASKHQAKNATDDMVIKVLSQSSLADGGYLVAPEFVDMLIPYLFKETAMEKLGCFIHETDKGSFTIPKQTGAVTTSWSGETVQPTESSPTFSNINLNLKECKAITAVSNKLIKGTAGAITRWVEEALAKGLAMELDRAFFYGNGSTEPLGLRYQVASANRFDANSTVNLANITSDISKAKELVEKNIHVADAGKFVVSSRTKNYLWALRNSLGVQEFAANIDNGILMGVPLIVSNTILNTFATSATIPATTGGALSEVYYIDPSKIVVGRAGGAEISISTEGSYYNGSAAVNAFDHDLTLIKINTQLDVKAMYDTALSVIDECNWV